MGEQRRRNTVTRGCTIGHSLSFSLCRKQKPDGATTDFEFIPQGIFFLYLSAIRLLSLLLVLLLLLLLLRALVCFYLIKFFVLFSILLFSAKTLAIHSRRAD
jgi:hypothetical protein